MNKTNMICVILLIPGKDEQRFVYDNEVFEDRKYAKQRINDALECGATICSFPQPKSKEAAHVFQCAADTCISIPKY